LWGVGTALFLGYCFAKYNGDNGIAVNNGMNRPDFKPYPAMLADEYCGKDTTMYKTMMEKSYWLEQDK